MEYDSKLVGIKIRSLREQKGWTQIELGNMLGLKQGSITNIENGRSSITKLGMINKILKIFDISFDVLFEDILDVFHRETDIDIRIENELSLMSVEQLRLANDIIRCFIEDEIKN